MRSQTLARWMLSVVLAMIMLSVWLLALNQAPISQSHALSTDYTVGGVCGTTIQACINNPIVQAGDRILIPAGTYNASITLNKAVSLIGANANTTIIRALSNQRVMTVTGSAISNSVIISGLTFSGGNLGLTTWDCPDDCGGGLLITNKAQPVIYRTVITGNSAMVGGGIAVISASVVLKNNQLYNNFVYASGGGIYLENSSSEISDNFIFGNDSSQGGGIYAWGGYPYIRHNQILSNTSYTGGGLYLLSTEAEVVDNQILANLARNAGGGVYIEYGKIKLSGNTILSNTNTNIYGLGGGLMIQTGAATLIHNWISNNIGGLGGGVGSGVSSLILDNNMIISNTASLWGGGLYMNTCTATLTNNVVAGNRTEQEGSGIFIYASVAQLFHTTVAQNRGGNGTGVQIAKYLSPSYVELTNTILVSHTIGISVTSDSTATLNATLWGADEWANLSNWQGDHVFLTNSVTGNPKFADPPNHDYHVLSDSAAIDTGINAGVYTDMDNQPRPYNLFDIGADEYWAPGALKQVYLPLIVKNH